MFENILSDGLMALSANWGECVIGEREREEDSSKMTEVFAPNNDVSIHPRLRVHKTKRVARQHNLPLSILNGLVTA